MSFVLWGLINGVYQIIGDLLKPIRKKIYKKVGINTESLIYKACSMITTFILISFTWIFFRAGSLNNSIEILKQMTAINSHA